MKPSLFSPKKSRSRYYLFYSSHLQDVQLLTTREPSSKELEVALSAIREAVGWHPSSIDDYIFTSLPEGY
ncbi:MAG: hypothetical protein AB1847_06015 [bacterium]